MFGTTIDVAGLYSYRDNLQISHGVKAGNTIYISGQVANASILVITKLDEGGILEVKGLES